MSEFYKLELNLLFQVCTKNGLEKAVLFNLMTLSPGAVFFSPFPSALEGSRMFTKRVLWTNVLLVVCSVLKIFIKTMWKRKCGFPGIPLT